MACGGCSRPGPPTISSRWRRPRRRCRWWANIWNRSARTAMGGLGLPGGPGFSPAPQVLAAARLPATRGAQARTDTTRLADRPARCRAARRRPRDQVLARTGSHRTGIQGAAAPQARAPGPRCVTATIVAAAGRLAPRRPALTAPVMIFVPGGAWVHRQPDPAGLRLMAHLAANGWCVCRWTTGCRPTTRGRATWTTMKTAIAWARANVDRFGGDRDFVTIAGCSAGGHLARWPA